MAFSVVVVGRKQTGLQCVTGWTAERSGKVVRLDISQHGAKLHAWNVCEEKYEFHGVSEVSGRPYGSTRSRDGKA